MKRIIFSFERMECKCGEKLIPSHNVNMAVDLTTNSIYDLTLFDCDTMLDTVLNITDFNLNSCNEVLNNVDFMNAICENEREEEVKNIEEKLEEKLKRLYFLQDNCKSISLQA